MTGSGKTGLCISLIEEAAIDGIPVIVIDPKGDLANLMLTFPTLRGEDFLPWINEEDAKKKGLSPEEYAKQQAELWKNGLNQWGESSERIKRLKSSADFVIYTPGSNAGIQISILKSFSTPDKAIEGASASTGTRFDRQSMEETLAGFAGKNNTCMEITKKFSGVL